MAENAITEPRAVTTEAEPTREAPMYQPRFDIVESLPIMRSDRRIYLMTTRS